MVIRWNKKRNGMHWKLNGKEHVTNFNLQCFLTWGLINNTLNLIITRITYEKS